MKHQGGFTLLEVLFAAALLLAIAYLIASIQTRVTTRLLLIEKTTRDTYAGGIPLCNNAALAVVLEQKRAQKPTTGKKEQEEITVFGPPQPKTTLAKMSPALRLVRPVAQADAQVSFLTLPFPVPPA